MPFSIRRYLKSFVQSKPLALIVGPVITGYFSVLDVWGNDWAFVMNYRDVHETIFLCLLSLSLIFWVIRASFKEEVDEETNMALNTVNDFILHIGTIVEKKIDRFLSKIPTLGANGDKFSLITIPDDQLEIILQEAGSFLMKIFKLENDCINLYVFEKRDGQWKNLRNMQRWTCTPQFCKAHSESIKMGEPIFFPSKNAAVKDKLIVWSTRDERRMKTKGKLKKYDGSLYIFPMVVRISDTEKKEYFVSISTYGKRLCEINDYQTIEVTKRFLREFCRRIEVELCLYTLKEI